MGLVEAVEQRFSSFKEALRPENRVGVLIYKDWVRQGNPRLLVYQHRPWETDESRKHHIARLEWAVDVFEHGEAQEAYQKHEPGDLIQIMPMGLGFVQLTSEEATEIGVDISHLREQCGLWIRKNSHVDEHGRRHLDPDSY